MPVLVIFIAIALFFATGMAAIAGLSLLKPGTILDELWQLNPEAYEGFRPMGAAAGPFLLALGAITLLAAIGLLLRKPWAWWLTILIFLANLGGDIADMVTHHQFLKRGFGSLIIVLFLALLLSPMVRNQFRRA